MFNSSTLAMAMLAALAKSDNVYASVQMNTDAILSPVCENVVRTNSHGGVSSSSTSEQGLVYASTVQFEIESFVTFDLTQIDFFHNHVLVNNEQFMGAKLEIFSFDYLPNYIAFDVGMMYQDNVNGMQWSTVSQPVHSSGCASSTNCWIDLDITDELLWSIEQQRNVENWNPSSSLLLVIRISIPAQEADVSGSFASSNYSGGNFAPKLSLDFFQEEANNIMMYSARSIQPPKKNEPKHDKVGIKGPRRGKKKNKKTKADDSIGILSSQDFAQQHTGQVPNKPDIAYNMASVHDEPNEEYHQFHTGQVPIRPGT